MQDVRERKIHVDPRFEIIGFIAEILSKIANNSHPYQINKEFKSL